MNRPWQTWLLFGLCLAMVLAAMGWVSWTVLRLEAAQAQAQRQAAFEEDVRLALWRMDSALAPLIAQENARPYLAYRAFYPAQQAYGQVLAGAQQGELLVRSELLDEESPYIVLYFQIDPAGRVTSPQVPEAGSQVEVQAPPVVQGQPDQRRASLEAFQASAAAQALARALPALPPRSAVVQAPDAGPQPLAPDGARGTAKTRAQSALNVAEWEARAKNLQQAAQLQQRQEVASPPGLRETGVGMLRPVWAGDVLVLARRVTINGAGYIQGCWLNWPAIRQWLLTAVNDVLPQADLAPVTAEPVGEAARFRMLAALLLGAVSLSERRAAFVSSVTHELRTPLTTLRMYTEMLAGDMVRDEAKRRQYLATLQREADRVAHLVENVLAYARLERGRWERRIEVVPLQDVLDRAIERLTERARQADMQLAVKCGAAETPILVRVDVSAVEQILFNLVDNACKYASMGEARAIEIQATADARWAVLRVRDHGPGVSPRDARRLFRPFSKSATEAAHSAPGVGLGLALSRRLARQMGGDLYLERTGSRGASFVLRLPALRTNAP